MVGFAARCLYLNELLDEAGYTEKDADGFRLWKDGSGETLSFVIEGTDLVGGGDAMEVITKHFADVGIKATYQYLERSLYTEHFQANELQAAWWGGDRTVLPLAPGAPIFRGTMIDRPWAPAWGRRQRFSTRARPSTCWSSSSSSARSTSTRSAPGSSAPASSRSARSRRAKDR